MAHRTDCKPLSLSFLGARWSRLWLRISPLVKADIEAASVAKLGRHFNERLLSEVHDREEAIVARERKGEEARSADPAQIEGLHLALIAAILCGRPIVV
jgi:hypothetical protein